MIPRLVATKEFSRWEKIGRRAHDWFSDATCFVINKDLENSPPVFDAFYIDPLQQGHIDEYSGKLVARGAEYSTSASCWARTAARRAMKFHQIVIENNYKCKENISPWFALFSCDSCEQVNSLTFHSSRRDFLLQTLAVAVKSRFPLWNYVRSWNASLLIRKVFNHCDA